jgi:hypothetical protein
MIDITGTPEDAVPQAVSYVIDKPGCFWHIKPLFL